LARCSQRNRARRATSNYAEGDKPEFVASLILRAIEEGEAQHFANERLRKMAGATP
jgi:hypothetical protein